MKKIYTEKFACFECKKPVGEYAKGNKERTVKSYTTVCLSCLNKVFCRQEDIREMLIKAMSGKLTIKKSDFSPLVDYLKM